MFDILQGLEMKKYKELITLPYHMFKTHEKLIKKLALNTAYGASD